MSFQAMTELRVKLRKTEECVASLTQDKADVVSHNCEMKWDHNLLVLVGFRDVGV